MILFCISGEEKTKQILFVGNEFSLLYVDIYFDVPKCKFILENGSL